MIDISGLDKAAVLAELWNEARDILPKDAMFATKPMTRQEAQAIMNHETDRDHPAQNGRDWDFTVFRGRLLEVDISGDGLDPFWYDAHNGEGSAARAVARLRSPDSPAGRKAARR